MIYILIGEMGIGKNYVGEQLAEFLKCEFFDGDTVIPVSMAEKVANFKPLTLEDIDNYVANNLLPSIQALYANRTKLVVAQALYRQDHRDIIESAFPPGTITFVHVKAPSTFTHMRRLLGRPKGMRWALFGLFNKLFFQKPSSDVSAVVTYVNAPGPMLESDYYTIV